MTQGARSANAVTAGCSLRVRRSLSSHHADRRYNPSQLRQGTHQFALNPTLVALSVRQAPWCLLSKGRHTLIRQRTDGRASQTMRRGSASFCYVLSCSLCVFATKVSFYPGPPPSINALGRHVRFKSCVLVCRPALRSKPALTPCNMRAIKAWLLPSVLDTDIDQRTEAFPSRLLV